MRMLLPLIPWLLLATGCGKSTPATVQATASFERSINGSMLWDWDFSNKTADNLSITQTYYTGSTTGRKQTRWTITFQAPETPVNFVISFPGIDSSASLQTGKDMTFTYRSNQTTPGSITCSLDEKGTLYLGMDSTFMDINLQTFSNGLATGAFSIQLYNPGATLLITQGHFSNVPIILSSQ